MKRLPIGLAVALTTAFVSSAAAAQGAALDRTVLPIPEPARPVYTELDARSVKPPPRFEVKAPAGVRFAD